jgi:hypothetical protein
VQNSVCYERGILLTYNFGIRAFEVDIMNRVSSVALVVLLTGLVCFGQTASSGPTPPQAAATKTIGHGSFPVKVIKTLDSSKLKEGDSVEVETAGAFKMADGTLVAKGSKLTGHIAASKARSKGDAESELTVVFDKLNAVKGGQFVVKGSVQAVFPPLADETNPAVAVSTMSKAGGPGYQPSDVKSGSNMEVSGNPTPIMEPTSVGVQGIRDLQLSNGVLSSKGKQVKLGNGVRMIVHVDILG